MDTNNLNYILNGGRLHQLPLYAEWNIKAVRDGVVIQEETKENLITNTGRVDVLDLLFGFGAGQPIIAMAAGACSTAAAVTDTRLNYEYSLLSGTRATLTNVSNVAISAGDVVAETITIGADTFYEKIVVQATYPANISDPTNGNPYQEYGLVSNASCPGTPTGTSGILFNHLVAGSAIVKDASTQIIVVVTLRI